MNKSFLLLFFKKEALSSLTGWRADLTACVLGAFSALAFTPLNIVPALLIAFPALLRLAPGAPFRRGFWFGFGQHLVGLYWITSAILVMAAQFWWFVPIAVPLLSATLALFIAVPVALACRLPAGLPRVLALPGLWVLGELARQFVGGGFPWNPLGSVWAIAAGVPFASIGVVMTQPAAWIGTPGLSLLTVLLACLPSLGRRGLLAAAIVLALWFGAGAWRLTGPDPASPGLDALLVQGDVPETEKHDASWAPAAFGRYLAMTRQGLDAAPGRPTLVIWPETASPYLLTQDAAARVAVAAAAEGAVATLAGAIRFDARDQAYNSLVAVLPDGSVGDVYDKVHLVTFGEYSPPWLPFHIAPGDLEPGARVHTLHLPGVPALGPMICYEAIFPAGVVDEGDRPALLVNITNDAWFGNSTGPRQHLQAARLRAIEEGLPLVRAANTGISAVFDAHGRELARLGLERRATLRWPLPGAGKPAPFARLGLIIPGVLSLLMSILGVAFAWRGVNKSLPLPPVI